MKPIYEPKGKDKEYDKAADYITDLLVENQSLRNAANGFKARAQANIEKLERRYPDGFSEERSRNRQEE